MQNPFGLFFLLCILKGLNFRVLGHNFEVKSRARETSFSEARSEIEAKI